MDGPSDKKIQQNLNTNHDITVQDLVMIKRCLEKACRENAYLPEEIVIVFELQKKMEKIIEKFL